MFTANDIKLYEMLKQRLGTQEAEALVGFVDAKLKEFNELNLKIRPTQEDLKDLKLVFKEDLKDLKLEFKEDMKNLKLELKKDMADLHVKMAETKTDTLKWVFAFLIPLFLAILGLYIKR